MNKWTWLAAGFVAAAIAVGSGGAIGQGRGGQAGGGGHGAMGGGMAGGSMGGGGQGRGGYGGGQRGGSWSGGGSYQGGTHGWYGGGGSRGGWYGGGSGYRGGWYGGGGYRGGYGGGYRGWYGGRGYYGGYAGWYGPGFGLYFGTPAWWAGYPYAYPYYYGYPGYYAYPGYYPYPTYYDPGPTVYIQKPPPVATAPAPPPPAPRAAAPRFERFTLSAKELFAFDRADLVMPQPKLDEIADALNRNPQITGVKITGYTDRLGSDAYNVELSQRRAEAVKGYLVAKGVAANRLVAVGRGEANPVVHCDQRSHAALVACLEPNRRVEIEPFTIERPYG